LTVGETVALNRVIVRALQFRQVNAREAFTLQDSSGSFFRASLLGATGRGGEALVYERMERSPESPLLLTLVCAVLARQRMIFVSQKATELGVARILPVFTDHSVGPEGLEHEKAHAWPGQALRAARQCRRSSVPEVRETVPLAEALLDEVWRSTEVRLYLDDAAAGRGDPGCTTGPPRVSTGSAVLAIGPEGGWSDPERERLRNAGALPLALSGRVLRAETAVVAGLTLAQHWSGDLH
jgi:16S rRNA (uracil1498-N3)-methyltransferase